MENKETMRVWFQRFCSLEVLKNKERWELKAAPTQRRSRFFCLFTDAAKIIEKDVFSLLAIPQLHLGKGQEYDMDKQPKFRSFSNCFDVDVQLQVFPEISSFSRC